MKKLLKALMILAIFATIFTACAPQPGEQPVVNAANEPVEPVATEPPSIMLDEPTPGAGGSAAPAVNKADAITAEEFSTMVTNTTTVSELLDQLDAAYKINPAAVGGAWTQEDVVAGNAVVPAGSVFWTDLKEGGNTLPAGVTRVRTDGNWGIYQTTVDFMVPLPDAGGRYAKIDGGLSQIRTLAIAEATANSCIATDDLNQIIAAGDKDAVIDAFNKYFEAKGYGFGQALSKGETAKANGVMLGTFDANNIPSTVIMLGDSGYVWRVNTATVAPNGGRWMAFCK